jgi:hypothetical protein
LGLSAGYASLFHLRRFVWSHFSACTAEHVPVETRDVALRHSDLLHYFSSVLLILSLGAYIGATLNSTVFHMPVEDFDQ